MHCINSSTHCLGDSITICLIPLQLILPNTYLGVDIKVVNMYSTVEPLLKDTSLYRTLHQVPKVSTLEGYIHTIATPQTYLGVDIKVVTLLEGLALGLRVVEEEPFLDNEETAERQSRRNNLNTCYFSQHVQECFLS